MSDISHYQLLVVQALCRELEYIISSEYTQKGYIAPPALDKLTRLLNSLLVVMADDSDMDSSPGRLPELLREYPSISPDDMKLEYTVKQRWEVYSNLSELLYSRIDSTLSKLYKKRCKRKKSKAKERDSRRTVLDPITWEQAQDDTKTKSYTCCSGSTRNMRHAVALDSWVAGINSHRGDFKKGRYGSASLVPAGKGAADMHGIYMALRGGAIHLPCPVLLVAGDDDYKQCPGHYNVAKFGRKYLPQIKKHDPHIVDFLDRTLPDLVKNLANQEMRTKHGLSPCTVPDCPGTLIPAPDGDLWLQCPLRLRKMVNRDRLCVCADCGHAWCSLCKVDVDDTSIHSTVGCGDLYPQLTAQRDQKFAAAKKLYDSELHMDREAIALKVKSMSDAKQKERADLLSFYMDTLLESDKKCPCGVRYRKVDGCNRVQCEVCGMHICHVCGYSSMSHGDVYDHFRSKKCVGTFDETG
jgi:hypothetical protein